MAEQWMRANLASAIYPFASELWGRSIIVPQYDQNFDRTINSTTDKDRDKGVPQAFYMHNCVPTNQGYQSIGYDKAVDAMAGTPTPDDFDAAFPIDTPSPDFARVIFVPASGKNYVYDAVIGEWASVSPFAAGSVPDSVQVTTAFIHGQTYIQYANYKTLTYNPTTRVMDEVTLTGLTAADINGLCSANGYMIAWDPTTIAWSSVVDETDFVPSLTTGAGGGSISDAKGEIICCLPIAGGFIVYCEQNAVSATYSGNIRFPFVFKEIPGSGGISSPEQVSWQSNLAEHYAWTTHGFQAINKSVAKDVYPEVSDFLSQKIFEDFDEAALQLIAEYLGTQLSIKLTVVEERYMIISYGKVYPNFTHALLYDIALNRWGKFKIDHRDCFEWNSPNLFGELTYDELKGSYDDFGPYVTYDDLGTSIDSPQQVKKQIAFLQQDGTIYIVNFDLAQTIASGVLIMGKYQFIRNRFIIHEECDVENALEGNNFDYYIFATIDGKTLLPAVKGFLGRLSPKSRRYQRHVEGQNVSSGFIGSFNLTSFLLNFSQGGDS